jgi:hypothetical protein
MSNIDNPITVNPLSSGYFFVSGIGPCNYSQPPWWPCDYGILKQHAHPEASEGFLLAASNLASTLYYKA